MKVPSSCCSRAAVGRCRAQSKADQVADCGRARCLCEGSPSNIAGRYVPSISLHCASRAWSPERVRSACPRPGSIGAATRSSARAPGWSACFVPVMVSDVRLPFAAEGGHASRSNQGEEDSLPQRACCVLTARDPPKRATACRSESVARREKFHARKPAPKRQSTHCDSCISGFLDRTIGSARNSPTRQQLRDPVVLAWTPYPRSTRCPATPDARL